MADITWLVLRDDLKAQAAFGKSPDIILGGTTPDPSFTSQYNTAFNATGRFGGTNYIYVRARNAGTGSSPAIGSVYVYAVRLASLQNPSEWILLHTSDGRDHTNIWAQAGKVGINGAPLIWEPGDAPPAKAPWCLVAQLVGDESPAPKVPSSVKDKDGFDSWIASQPTMAYLVVQTPVVPPAEAPTFGWTRTVALGNTQDATLSVSLTCAQGPAGGSLAYSLDQPDSSGQAIGVGKVRYRVGNAYSQSRPVAAGYSSSLTVSYTPPDDMDTDAQFTLEVATETSNGDDGDLGDTTKNAVASYTLRFGQTKGN
jgi:hypothetical protein